MTKKYRMGNILRGHFVGEFEDDDTAWLWLSERFNLSYPSAGGRSVGMRVLEKNSHGFEEYALCREGVTTVNTGLDREEVLARCQRF